MTLRYLSTTDSKVGIRTSKNLLRFGLNSWNTIIVGLKAARWCIGGLKSLSYMYLGRENLMEGSTSQSDLM